MSNISNSMVVSNIIYETTKLKGDFVLDTVLRIDGEFSGKIKSSSKVLIGEKGKAYCDIEAEIVEIGGILKGNVKAKEKIHLFSTGIVEGNLEAPRVILEEGVTYNGEIKVIK